MSLTLPASMQQIVGGRFLRLGTSYDRTRFFIDIPKADPYRGRTRYGYRLTSGVISGSYNLAPLLGSTVLSISASNETGPQGKIIFTSNPTGSKVEHSILYVDVVSDLEYLLEEDGDFLLQENGDRIILEAGDTIEDVVLSDTTLPANTYQSVDSDTKFFVIQEDDF